MNCIRRKPHHFPPRTIPKNFSAARRPSRRSTPDTTCVSRKSKPGARLRSQCNPPRSSAAEEFDLSSYVRRRSTSQRTARGLLENAANHPHGKAEATFIIAQRVRPGLARVAAGGGRDYALERLPGLEYKEHV